MVATRRDVTELSWVEIQHNHPISNLQMKNVEKLDVWMFNMRQVKKCVVFSFLECANFNLKVWYWMILDFIWMYVFLKVWSDFSAGFPGYISVGPVMRKSSPFNGAHALRPDFWKSQQGKAQVLKAFVQQRWWTVYFEVIFEVKLCRYQSYLYLPYIYIWCIYIYIYTWYLYIYIYDVSEMLRS